ncbi:phosphatase PAP2 family protein [Massilia sp. R2A-15]|uniref:phosphatase PAP2 family protein n=1 Tax=Massilia sp. R2A-15 TaxID=3064278 RepID=UPI002733425E|nr:phosphatase PAP2 family protein [Massilia sp. R2A-15]WLI90420.1 phosphatase PAP2 family protein [Massilia sp. R2A-15]
MSTSSFPRLRRFLAARLSPEGQTGLHLTVGVLLMVAAAWLFGDIAEDVVHNESITLLDVRLAHWFHVNATASMTRFMLLISNWHGMVGAPIMAALLALFFYRRRQHYWMMALFAVVPGGMLLNVLLKYVFHRARPSFDDPLLSLTTYSFPSGHTANAALLYGLVACWLWVHHRSIGARAACVAGACTMVALVGISRMYLGVHYLSDVLAAAAEGCAWLAVCITAISTLRRRRQGHSLNQPGRDT